jgi:photosystem II stability/assembly factor-like uncharacterized protein
VSERFYVGTRKGLFTIERGGTGWKIARADFLGDNVSMVAPLHDGDVMVSLDHGHFGGKMHRSTDGGKTWPEVGVPTYPPMPEGHVEPPHPMLGVAVTWNLRLVWSLERGGDNEPGVVWAGTVPGGLFKSTNNGDSWELNTPLWMHPDRQKWFGGGMEYPGIHSISVDPRNPRRVAVGVSAGGVWLTEDGGSTWEVRSHGMRNAYMPPDQAYDPIPQDAHRVVQCPGQPDHWWTQHHNGIFHCSDDLKSWTEIENAEPSVFGFAVAVHPKQGDTAWFVPAIKDEFRYPVDGKLAVSRTTDGGKSWDVLRKGLPQEHAYDLTWRHGLDVDDTGNRLAFGTTTGSVFASDDGGDSWQTVSTHLPPVHCVRFAK